MKILTYPDPILTQVSEPVTDFEKISHGIFLQSLGQFCDDLHDVMIESNGVGLSAVQVGVLKRIIVMQIPGGKRFTFINPVIFKHFDDTFAYSEGCLSVPGYYETRERYKSIMLHWQDERGETREGPFSDLEAFCILHEMDHLDGKLFIDDLSPLKKDRIRKKIEKTLRR